MGRTNTNAIILILGVLVLVLVLVYFTDNMVRKWIEQSVFNSVISEVTTTSRNFRGGKLKKKKRKLTSRLQISS